jgi:hypothetical protein
VAAAALSLVSGDDGASPGILIPVRQPPAGNLMAIPAAAAPCSATCAAYRGEHGFALITGCWRSFTHIGHDKVRNAQLPSKIVTKGGITLQRPLHWR